MVRSQLNSRALEPAPERAAQATEEGVCYTHATQATGARGTRRRVVRAAAAGALAMLALLGVAAPATAGGQFWTWGPGVGGYARAQVGTVSKTATGEYMVVMLDSGRYDKANRCGHGISIWYTDPWGTQRNWYVTNDGCTGGPVFWYTAYPTVKRGTCVQVTYRAEWQWYSGPRFCSQ